MLIALGCALIVIAAILIPRWNGEPRYGGHSLSYWVKLYAETWPESKRSDQAVRHIGNQRHPLPFEVDRRKNHRQLSGRRLSTFRFDG